MLRGAVPLMTVCLNIWELKSRQELGEGGDAAITCGKNAPFQKQDNRSNANDQAPFGSPFPRRDPLGAVLHLATRGRQNVPGILFLFFLLSICMRYRHVILFVGKSRCGET